MSPISAAHVLILAPALIYLGIYGNTMPDSVYTGILVAGILIALYHLYRAYSKIVEGKSAWVNWIHILVVAPLLIYIGANRKETPRRFFEMLLMAGFAGLGYHGYYLIRESASA